MILRIPTRMRGCPKEIIDKTSEGLTDFRTDLPEAGLSPKTIQNHLDGAKMFARYAWRHYDKSMVEASTFVLESFLGTWVIRDCLWSTPSSLKSTGAGLKKTLHKPGPVSYRWTKHRN